MSGKWGRMFAGVMIALPLGACITMQKKEDGKTHISIPNPLAGLLKGEEADSRGGKSTGNAMQDRRQAAQTAAGGSSTRQTSANGNGSGEVALFDPRWTDAPMISETPLANLWRKHPWDGQGLGQYPAVALTIVDWSFSTNHFRQRMQNGGLAAQAMDAGLQRLASGGVAKNPNRLIHSKCAGKAALAWP